MTVLPSSSTAAAGTAQRSCEAAVLRDAGGPNPITYADIASVGGACAQWDAVPTLGKLQILGAIGILEIWGEAS